MLTRRAGHLFIVACFCLIAAWASGSIFFYFACAFVISLLITAWLFSRIIPYCFFVERVLAERAVEGDTLPVCLRVRARLPLFEYFEIIDHFFPEKPEGQEKKFLVVGVGRRQIELTYVGICDRRGLYQIGPIQVRVFDPLGIFCVVRPLAVFSRLRICPLIFPVRHFPFVLGSRAPRFGRKTTRISGDYEEFYGIREYRQEDGWRRIHWRSTARRNELMVRHFEQSSQWRALVILDGYARYNIGADKESVFEYGVKVAASVLNYLSMRNAEIGLAVSSAAPVFFPLAQGYNHFMNLWDQLSTVAADGEMPLHTFLLRHLNILPVFSSLIVISADSEYRLRHVVKIAAAQRHCAVIPIYIDKISFQEEMLSRPAQPPGQTPPAEGYLVRRGADLEQVFFGANIV
ncbi:MAG: DUF58 domain-containing protein [Candidatus Omnitrophica bacterium]|nr:DUF58 domain-containing protein [Candidatus Omnitrophota bacterium]